MEKKKIEQIDQLEQLAVWVKDNTEALKSEGKSICIYICDDKEEKVQISFAGDMAALLMLKMHIDDAIDENADKAIKELLKKILED